MGNRLTRGWHMHPIYFEARGRGSWRETSTYLPIFLSIHCIHTHAFIKIHGTRGMMTPPDLPQRAPRCWAGMELWRMCWWLILEWSRWTQTTADELRGLLLKIVQLLEPFGFFWSKGILWYCYNSHKEYVRTNQSNGIGFFGWLSTSQASPLSTWGDVLAGLAGRVSGI